MIDLMKEGGEAPLLGLCGTEASALPIVAIRPDGLPAMIERATPARRAWLAGCGFTAEAGTMVLLPGPSGVEGALAGLGAQAGPFAFGGLAARLPARDWRLDPGSLADAGIEAHDAVLGFGLGAYRCRGGERARLAVPAECGLAVDMVRASVLARDLINTPPNLLGPDELAEAARSIARRAGARFERVEGDALAQGFPAIAAVGQGSARRPVVASLSWRGSGAGDASLLISLAGKGVCFDTGGYDIKPSAGMLRMKKDMGGAAVMLALAALVMRRDLPVRLDLRIGCVENSVSGTAMRPSDVVTTRAGLTIEINNTDAEGRLVLADLLTAACDSGARSPDLLVDMATLTGAARVALGPDLPALFTDSDATAHALLASGVRAHDPMWRLPLWHGYDDWLKSGVADIANVSGRTHAGAVVAALFLQRFVPPGIRWVHLDAYCWNDADDAGRPEGGEAPCLRALYGLITNLCENGTSAFGQAIVAS